MVDKDGKAFGDERYFEAGRIGDDVDFYSLMNQDGDYCVYSPDGRLVMPYGILTGDDESPYINGLSIENCVSSYDAICFVTKDDDGKNEVSWYGKTE